MDAGVITLDDTVTEMVPELQLAAAPEQLSALDAASAVPPPYPYYPYHNGQFSERKPPIAPRA